jgi:hypothetical protein
VNRKGSRMAALRIDYGSKKEYMFEKNSLFREKFLIRINNNVILNETHRNKYYWEIGNVSMLR